MRKRKMPGVVGGIAAQALMPLRDLGHVALQVNGDLWAVRLFWGPFSLKCCNQSTRTAFLSSCPHPAPPSSPYHGYCWTTPPSPGCLPSLIPLQKASPPTPGSGSCDPPSHTDWLRTGHLTQAGPIRFSHLGNPLGLSETFVGLR